MDEKQLAEITKFVKANPGAFKEAKKWYKETDFLSKKDAWDESVVFNDWDKILFLVNNFFSEDYEEACFMLYLGIEYTNDIHPTDKIIEVALKKGKKAVASKNHNNDPFKEEQSAIKDKGCWHNEDFTTVIWYGTEYQFNKTQARCIKHLWENDSASEKSIGIMLDSAACTVYRLRDTFRRKTGYHCAWGKMIISAGKGCFKLNKPQS